MKRSKSNRLYWEQRRQKLYTAHPSSMLTENRIKSLQAVLREKYPTICDREEIYKFLKDAIYNDRRMRKDTEGMQEELKKQLSEKYKKQL